MRIAHNPVGMKQIVSHRGLQTHTQLKGQATRFKGDAIECAENSKQWFQSSEEVLGAIYEALLDPARVVKNLSFAEAPDGGYEISGRMTGGKHNGLNFKLKVESLEGIEPDGDDNYYVEIRASEDNTPQGTLTFEPSVMPIANNTSSLLDKILVGLSKALSREFGVNERNALDCTLLLNKLQQSLWEFDVNLSQNYPTGEARVLKTQLQSTIGPLPKGTMVYLHFFTNHGKKITESALRITKPGQTGSFIKSMSLESENKAVDQIMQNTLNVLKPIFKRLERVFPAAPAGFNMADFHQDLIKGSSTALPSIMNRRLLRQKP